MDYSSAAYFSSHSQIVSGRKKAIWFSSCLASTAHSNSDVCLNTVIYILYSVIYKSTVTEQTHTHSSFFTPQLFQNVIYQFTTITVILSICRTCSWSASSGWAVWLLSVAIGDWIRRGNKGDFTADFNLKVKDFFNHRHRKRHCAITSHYITVRPKSGL